MVIDLNDILGRMTLDCFINIAFGHSANTMQSFPKHHPFGVAFDEYVIDNELRMCFLYIRISLFLCACVLSLMIYIYIYDDAVYVYM